MNGSKPTSFRIGSKSPCKLPPTIMQRFRTKSTTSSFYRPTWSNLPGRPAVTSANRQHPTLAAPTTMARLHLSAPASCLKSSTTRADEDPAGQQKARHCPGDRDDLHLCFGHPGRWLRGSDEGRNPTCSTCQQRNRTTHPRHVRR